MLARIALFLAVVSGVLSLTPAQAAPVRASAQERGITLWAWDDFAYGAPNPYADTPGALASMKAVGADTVAFVPTWFQLDGASSGIQRTSWTATDAALRSGIASARAAGLAVTLKPHVDTLDGSWRGAIAPANVDAWFASYRSTVLGYARLARDSGVTQFVVGTELAGVSAQTSKWRALIADVRKIYRGRLTYAALPFEYQRIGFWSSLDVVGVDAYWKLAPTPTADVDTLKAAWKPIVAELAAFSARVGKPILFTEAGFTDQVGTTTDPSSWTLAGPSPEGAAEQAAAYRALLETFKDKPWFRGVHWWAWRQTNRTEAGDFTPQGKPAEAVLRSAWTR